MTQRAAGILLHITSLPSPYGVGSLGKAAFAFADFLHRAGQTLWQVLPLGPTGFGDSPYQCLSAFAGNPLFVDLDELADAGLLERDALAGASWGDDPAAVDYAAVHASRHRLLWEAYQKGWPQEKEQVQAFLAEHAWLPDYALYRALKDSFGQRPWVEWPAALRQREPHELARARRALRQETDFHCFTQYLFFRQWHRLGAHCRRLGVKLFGDMPIYVPLDSADVWADQQLFRLDSEGLPLRVAGVPPDYFSCTGQLWGSPLYDYERMARDGFCWWRQRIRAAAGMLDALRIDHFRGFASYWSVEAGQATAERGIWSPGAGEPLIDALREAAGSLRLVAEDLGLAAPDVEQLLAYSGWPGMRVLQFAFDGGNSPHLPRNHVRNAVCYTGTHDNDTVTGWARNAPQKTLQRAMRKLGAASPDELPAAMLQAGQASRCDWFVAPLQDYLGLPSAARMNIPGTCGGNWRWRAQEESLTGELADHIRRSCAMYGRCGV